MKAAPPNGPPTPSQAETRLRQTQGSLATSATRLPQAGTGPTSSPATRHRVEFVVPEDQRLLLLRVQLDGDWSGDLLFASPIARSAFLEALTAGEITVTRYPIPLTDVCTELGIPPAAEADRASPRRRGCGAGARGDARDG